MFDVIVLLAIMFGLSCMGFATLLVTSGIIFLLSLVEHKHDKKRNETNN